MKILPLIAVMFMFGGCGKSGTPAAPAATAAPAGPAPAAPPAPDAVTGTTDTAPTAASPGAPGNAPAETGHVSDATPGSADAASAAGGTPYHIVDGRIDQNTVEGWKIYRGVGTCATCHGPVGQGGVGPALTESLKEKITKELFVEVVTNGRPGTMMKPFGENRIVMDNLDNIYAYLKARSDGVLGPEHLLKYPLGKIE